MVCVCRMCLSSSLPRCLKNLPRLTPHLLSLCRWALGVKTVGKNVLSNADAHYTTDYETQDLVVRRGMPFDLTVTFDRQINVDADSITLQFCVGQWRDSDNVQLVLGTLSP